MYYRCGEGVSLQYCTHVHTRRRLHFGITDHSNCCVKFSSDKCMQSCTTWAMSLCFNAVQVYAYSVFRQVASIIEISSARVQIAFSARISIRRICRVSKKRLDKMTRRTDTRDVTVGWRKLTIPKRCTAV